VTTDVQNDGAQAVAADAGAATPPTTKPKQKFGRGRWARKGHMKRTRKMRLRDLDDVSRMMLRGYTAAAIKDAINAERPENAHVTEEMVYRDIHLLTEKWERRSALRVDKWKTIERQKLDAMESELWEQWERSKQDKVKQGVRENSAPGGATGAQAKYADKEGRVGNPVIMQTILKVQERRARLLGLDEPDRSEVSGPDGTPLSHSGKGMVVILPSNGRELIKEGHGNGHGNGGTNGGNGGGGNGGSHAGLAGRLHFPTG
jgi:hypothetical protein